MADVLIHDAVSSGPVNKSGRQQVFVSRLIGYQFYSDSVLNDLFYEKTTDGGQTWGAAVTVSTALIAGFDVWYDKWTPGITGTLIHIAYIDNTSADVFYKNLDTASDTLGSEVAVYAGTTVDTRHQCSIAKMRGGNLYLWFMLGGAIEAGLCRSTDGGVNWTERSDTGIVEDDDDDIVLVFPGNETDNQDPWFLFQDRTGAAISLKVHSDSGDSTAETAIAAMAWVSLTTVGYGFSASVRHSDNHLILAYFTERDSATGDLKVYDIASTASITAKTNITTDKDDMYNPCVCIDQATGDIYVGYMGKADGSETIGTSVTPFYQKSTDGGTTWGGEQAYGETGRAHLAMSCDLGGSGGSRFMPCFRDNGASDLYLNYVNSVAIGSAGGGSPGNSGNAPGRNRGNPNPGRGGGQGGGGGGGGGTGGGQGNPLNKGFLGTRRRQR